MTRNAQLFTSETAEHNTPVEIIDAMRDVFGGAIGLDPASNDVAQGYIQAHVYCTAEQEAARIAAHGVPTLNLNWHTASLWLNPPFTIPTDRINKTTGKPIRKRVIAEWVARWYAAVIDREADQAALLVPARTDTEWFNPLFGLPMCFITGRLHFSEAENGATFPTVIIYAGNRTAKFYERFSAFGNVGKFTR